MRTRECALKIVEFCFGIRYKVLSLCYLRWKLISFLVVCLSLCTFFGAEQIWNLHPSSRNAAMTPFCAYLKSNFLEKVPLFHVLHTSKKLLNGIWQKIGRLGCTLYSIQSGHLFSCTEFISIGTILLTCVQMVLCKTINQL